MSELQLMKSKSFKKHEKIKFKIAWIPDQLPTNITRGNEPIEKPSGGRLWAGVLQGSTTD